MTPKKLSVILYAGKQRDRTYVMGQAQVVHHLTEVHHR